MKAIVVAMLTASFVASGGLAAAQESIGQAEYMSSCAICHGPEGKGDGYLAGYLKKAPPSLTGLQEANGGVFPVSSVYELIDGTQLEGAHGTSAMPVWGDRYTAQAEEEFGRFTLGFEPSRQVYVRVKILALVEYIATLQAQ